MIAEDQEQVDKMLELRAQIPRVERVIYWDPKGMRSTRTPGCCAVPIGPGVRERRERPRKPDRFERMVEYASRTIWP